MQTGLFILESSKRIFPMDLARRLNLTDHSMWDNYLKGCSKGKASLSGQMGLSMKVNGRLMR